MKSKLSDKAKELKNLSFERNYSENLHDYLGVLIDEDDKIQQMLDYLKKNEAATEDEIFDEIDNISPPPIIEVK